VIRNNSELLEKSLLLTFVLHGFGILSMAFLLLPGMPGGGTVDDAARIHYIASHPWFWRFGWFPWQLTAISDFILAIALLRTTWIPKLPAALTLVVTIFAIIPDQLGQLNWITKGIQLAQTNPFAYLPFEKQIFHWTAAWGATFYCVAAVGWTWCFIAAKTWNRTLTVLSTFLWALFFVVCVGPFFAMNPKLVAAGNGVGFLLLQLWFVLVLEAVQRSSRPNTAHGRYAIWRHPRFHFFDPIANSRFLRSCGELAPVVSLRSNITNVVYVNYIVEADLLQPFVPEGLELQRLGPEKKFALMTFLTFRHGGFGPRFFGPLRRALPSPIQTNWRIHVRDPKTRREGIYFVTNAITSTLYGISARLLSEGMPMHVLQNAEVNSGRVYLNPGNGTAPDCDAVLHHSPIPESGPWSCCFKSWKDFLAYAVPQDRALSTQPWCKRITIQEIHLGIPLDICQPLEGEVHSDAVAAIVGEAKPFCFFVPHVNFLFEREEFY
jgi:hypothetical protein